jgi:hypothetical protein
MWTIRKRVPVAFWGVCPLRVNERHRPRRRAAGRGARRCKLGLWYKVSCIHPRSLRKLSRGRSMAAWSVPYQPAASLPIVV